MARLKILFADDQIPDDAIPDADLAQVLSLRNPHWPANFLRAFVEMRRTVRTLQKAGYAVMTVHTYSDAMSLAKDRHFDIAIVDLGWFADESLSDPDYAGWDICEAIDDGNQARADPPTPQIIYSNRFAQDTHIGVRAASQGKLPFYKGYTEASDQALLAAVMFVETLLPATPVKASPAATPAVRAQPKTDRWRIYNNLIEWLSDEELDEVCFALSIDEDTLQRGTKPVKARELIRYCERRSMLEQLVKVCRAQRPDVNW